MLERRVDEPPFAVEGFSVLDARDYGAARVHFLSYSPAAG
jgi:16S rRNA (guanine966-N2)-methyltransferase